MNEERLKLLPPDTRLHFWCAEDDLDEDLIWIELGNGVGVDVGWYRDHYGVVVVSQHGQWEIVENSAVRTRAEADGELVRLAWKYSDQWFADYAAECGKAKEKCEKLEEDYFSSLHSKVESYRIALKSIAAQLVCRCDVCWTGRNMHAPDCYAYIGDEAREALDNK